MKKKQVKHVDKGEDDTVTMMVATTMMIAPITEIVMMMPMVITILMEITNQ